MRYYISDLHFYHSNLNEKLDKRAFSSMDEMNNYMISQWNKKVHSQDEVVVLGDFSFGDGNQTNDILRKLNGTKYLIIGNHDRYLKDKQFVLSSFKWIEPYKVLNENHRKVVLSHYPIMCYDGQYRRDLDNNPITYMLYGHVHNTYDEILINHFINETHQTKRLNAFSNQLISIPCQMINCFCMFSDYTPLTLDEWITVDTKRRGTLPLTLESYND